MSKIQPLVCARGSGAYPLTFLLFFEISLLEGVSPSVQVLAKLTFVIIIYHYILKSNG